MSTTPMQPEEKTGSAAAKGSAPATQAASFGTALIGFMITTTLTTSIMVLLSQGPVRCRAELVHQLDDLHGLIGAFRPRDLIGEHDDRVEHGLLLGWCRH